MEESDAQCSSVGQGKGKTVRRATAAALAAILLLALALRLVGMDVSYWYDEVLTHERGLLPVKTIWETYSDPVAFLVAHAALHWGDSEVVVRLPFLAAGLLAVWGIYVLGKHAADRPTGLAAAFLLATSSCHVHFTRDARYYGLIMLGTILAVWWLTRCAGRGGFIHAVLMVCLALVAVKTHAFLVITLGFAGLGALTYTLFSKHFQTKKAKLGRLVLLGVCLAPVAVALAADYGPPVKQLLTRTTAGDAEINAAAETPSPPEKRYKLGVREYIGYFRQVYYPGRSKWGHAFIAVLGLLGLLRLWRTNRPMACIVTCVVCLLPLPFFLMTVGHWYRQRYFTMQVPLTRLLIALGVVGTARFAGSVAARCMGAETSGEEHTQSKPAMVVTAAVLALLAVLVVPPDVRALAAYYEKGAREDWRGAAQYLTRWVRPSDVVVYWGDRGWRTTVAKPVLFYADRVPQNDGILDRVASFGTQDPQELRTIVQTHADTTVWVVSRDNGSWRDLDPIAPLLASFMPIRVRACGAPTVNLVHNGGFETAPLPKNCPGSAALTDAQSAYAGEHALRLSSNSPSDARIVLPAASRLDDTANYVLALQVKSCRLRQSEPPKRSGSVFISGKDPKGKPFAKHLFHVVGTHDWEPRFVPLKPGRDFPAGATDLGIGVDLEGCTGTLWVDNIQLERGRHPTPFVSGARQPLAQAPRDNV